MSQLNTKKVKFGDNVDLSKNFVWSVPAVADGTFTLAREDGTIVWQIPTPGGAITLNNSLSFSGTGKRITGDFSNATVSNRLFFQTSTVNSFTAVAAMPNGSSTAASIAAYGKSDPNNSNLAVLIADGTPGAEVAILSASVAGAGVASPLAFYTNTTERFRLSATANRFQAAFGGAVVENRFMFQNSAVDTTTNVGVMPSGTGVAGILACYSHSNPSALGNWVSMSCDAATATIATNKEPGSASAYLPMTFNTAGAERIRIGGTTGNVGISAIDNGLGPNSSLSIAYDGGGAEFGITMRGGSTFATAISFQQNSTAQVGYIATTTTTTSYNTTSDYRLKEHVKAMVAPLSRLLRLNPVTFNWKADGSEGEGFIAHELQVEVPLAVTGEKDGEEMQGVDFGKVVPLLVAAVQELTQRVIALEAAS